MRVIRELKLHYRHSYSRYAVVVVVAVVVAVVAAAVESNDQPQLISRQTRHPSASQPAALRAVPSDRAGRRLENTSTAEYPAAFLVLLMAN